MDRTAEQMLQIRYHVPVTTDANVFISKEDTGSLLGTLSIPASQSSRMLSFLCQTKGSTNGQEQKQRKSFN